jgi:hypothetical protein
MKKFTDTQKKWALTATMIAALGCSVSFNSHTNGFASLDLASESDGHKLIQVPTSKGMLDVHLIAAGDKTTAVTSPVKDAEGKATFDCKECIKTMTLDKKITDNVADIQVAIMAELVKAPAKKEEKVVKEASEVREERKTSGRDEAPLREERKSKLRSETNDEAELLADYIDDKCSSGQDDDGRRRRSSNKSSNCVADNFLAYATKYKVSDSVLANYYIEEIEPDLAEQISGSIDSQDEDGYRESTNADETISKLLRKLPGDGTRKLRQAIVQTSTKAVVRSAAEARRLVLKAKQSRRTIDLKAAIDQINATGAYAEELRVFNQDALFDLDGNNKISQAQARSIYNSAYGNVVEDIKTGIVQWVPAQAYGNPNAINIDTYQLPTFKNGLNFGSDIGGGVLRAPGYGNNDNSNSSDWSGQGVNQGSNNGVLIAPQMLQQNTSNGTQFGQPRTASPQALEAARQIRAQQGQSAWVQQ